VIRAHFPASIGLLHGAKTIDQFVRVPIPVPAC
jgi:hypothetical protein